MLLSEFEARTGVNVSADEFAAIHAVYMASDVDKDEFCNTWKRLNRARVKAAADARKRAQMDDAARGVLIGLYNILAPVVNADDSRKWDDIDDYLTARQRWALEYVGIDTAAPGQYFPGPFPRPVWDVFHDIRRAYSLNW